VKWAAALLLALAAMRVDAATAYVSDELVLGVYTGQNSQGQRLTTLHSGAAVDTLSVSGEFTQVRLSDGTTGWVKSAYLTTREPAASRVKQLEEELDRSRATTPALAEAAARSEVKQLQDELKAKQSELDAAVTPTSTPATVPGAHASGAAAASLGPWEAFLAVAIALACGFWLGYAVLARRIKHKFGGIKVY